MQVKRNLPDTLYAAQPLLKNPSKKDSLNLKIFNASNSQMNSLTAYYSNPDRIGFLSTIKNVLAAFFGKNTVVLVKIDQRSNPIYVRISDLSKILKGKSIDDIRKDLKGKNAEQVAPYIQMEVTIQKMKSLIRITVPDETVRNTLRNLSSIFGLKREHIYTLLDDTQQRKFPNHLIATRLMELGIHLRKTKISAPENIIVPESITNRDYQFKIDKNGIFIEMKGDEKNFILDLKTANIREENISDEQKLLRSFKNMGLYTPKNVDNIKALAEKISFPTILKVLNDTRPESSKLALMNTFLAIGAEIRVGDLSQKYFKVVKERRKLTRNAFGISNDHIFITMSTKGQGGRIGKGGFKVVNQTTRINFLDNAKSNSLRSDQQVFSQVRIKPIPEATGILLPAYNQALDSESSQMRELLKDNPFAVKLHSFRAYSRTGKIVLCQDKCDGDGEKLRDAPLHHQLNALKDLGFGVALLHEKGFIHMDLKPANLFFVGDPEDSKNLVQGKMADIGLVTQEGKNLNGGSSFYLPREALTLKPSLKYNEKCHASTKIDSYSYGMTILDMLFHEELGETHFGKYSKEEFNSKVPAFFTDIESTLNLRNKEDQIRFKILKVCEKLIKFNPKERMECHAAAAELQTIQTSMQSARK